jgi:hypothetical protein
VAVFGYIEGSFRVSSTDDAHEDHVPNIYIWDTKLQTGGVVRVTLYVI